MLLWNTNILFCGILTKTNITSNLFFNEHFLLYGLFKLSVNLSRLFIRGLFQDREEQEKIAKTLLLLKYLRKLNKTDNYDKICLSSKNMKENR